MNRLLKKLSVIAFAVLAGYITFKSFEPTYLLSVPAFVDVNDLGFRLLVSFGTGVAFVTTYTGIAAYREADKKRRLNDLTQLYSGIVLILSMAAILVANAVSSWTIGDLYIVFVTTALTIGLLTMKQYNRLIQKYA